MFATFALPVRPAMLTEGGAEARAITTIDAEGAADASLLGFADLLEAGVHTTADQAQPIGDFLPEGGSVLPAIVPIELDPATELAEPVLLNGSASSIEALAGSLEAAAAKSLLPTDQRPVANARPELLPATTVPDIELENVQLRPNREPTLLQANLTTTTELASTQPVTAPQVLVSTLAEVSGERRPRTDPQQSLPQTGDTFVKPLPPPEPQLRTPVPVTETDVAARFAQLLESNPGFERNGFSASNSPQAAIASLSSQTLLPTGFVSRDVELQPGATPGLIRTPVGSPEWGDRIGERLLMMASKGRQRAEIQLSPAELGPVRVRIMIEDGAANVTFQAQHGVTRDALESALPRLREMLSEQGVSLGQATVAEERNAQRQGERADGGNSESAADADGDLDDLRDSQDGQTSGRILRGDGLIDAFV